MVPADNQRASEQHAAPELALINRIARIAIQDLDLRPMLARIVHAVKQHSGCELVTCASLNLESGRFVCEAIESDIPTGLRVGYGSDIGSGVVGEVAATGRTLLVADTRLHANYIETTQGVCSELCVPVLHGGEVIAVLNAESPRVDAFRDQRGLFEAVAEHVAGAIAAARMHQQLTRRVALLGMMSDLLRSALDAGDLEQALDHIAAFVRDRFALELCVILLADENQQRITMNTLAGHSLMTAHRGQVWPTDVGITGRAFRTGQEQFVPDVGLDPDYVMGNRAVNAEYVLPIRFRDRVLGLIDMEGVSADSFSAENRQMLRALADQVAGAIYLARANERLREINRVVEEKSVALELANVRLRDANAALERLSNLDGLTGVANRRRFDEGLRREWRRARRRGRSLGLLLIDIDDFKAYNDGYGHLAGDDCLKRVAALLRDKLHRAEDLLARYGGEEFAVLLPEADGAAARRCAEYLHTAIATAKFPHQFARVGRCVSVSIGVVSIVPHSGIKPSDFIRMADRELYRAKGEGRNRIAQYAGGASGSL